MTGLHPAVAEAMRTAAATDPADAGTDRDARVDAIAAVGFDTTSDVDVNDDDLTETVYTYAETIIGGHRQLVASAGMTHARYVETRTVPLTDLRPHPDNPNHGDVQAIAASLGEFGQYRSIVAQPDGTILAGHHVVQALAQRGETEARVDIIDCDDQTAKRIMLADNRIPELGDGLDDQALLDLLQSLDGDLTGTGYDTDYLTMLEEITDGPPSLDDLEEEAGGKPRHDDHNTIVRLNLDPPLAEWWAQYRLPFTSDTNAIVALRQAAGQ